MKILNTQIGRKIVSSQYPDVSILLRIPETNKL